jgi:subtilase family serine protease
LRTVAVACLAALAGSAALGGSATASVARAGSPRGAARFVRVGSVPQLSPAAVPLGPAPGSQPIEVDVALRPRDPAALAKFASEVSTPGSAEFGSYLRPGVFGSVFGATVSTISSTIAALRRLGLHVGLVSSNHLIITASSTVAAAEHAFDTTLVRYRLGSGVQVYANRSAPRVPAALAGAIEAIAGLDDLALAHSQDLLGQGPAARARPPGATRTSTATTAGGGPQPCSQASSGASPGGPYTADELASAYGFSGLYEAGDLGAGETVAVFELQPFSQPDVRTYDECYFGTTQGAAMASPPLLNVITVDGSQEGLGSGTGGYVESTGDVEEISSLVPGAKIDVYEGPNNATGPLDVYNAIVTQDRAQVISTSWGDCEAQAGGSAAAAAEANLFEEAAAQGQTVVAASGDDGSTDCTDASNNPIGTPAVDDPGSQPYVTGVGGTSLTALGSAPTATAPAVPPTQTVWNDDAGASGGGMSSDWAMPAYQSDAPAALQVIKAYSSNKPCGMPTGYCREVPDVAGDADPSTGLLIYLGAMGGWSYFGGTSIAAPLWAAVATLADAWPTCRAHPVGFLNPSLYFIAGEGPSEYASAFDEVTKGDNHLAQFPDLWQYPATPGYDLATGLGTPIAANALGGGLVAELCALPESGGASYASPTRSSVTAVLARVKAMSTASSWIKVILRTALGLPIRAKRVILVATATATATAPSAVKTEIKPLYLTTNAKGVAIFQVSDTMVQKVTYKATDLTDGVLIDASATVSYVKP